MNLFSHSPYTGINLLIGFQNEAHRTFDPRNTLSPVFPCLHEEDHDDPDAVDHEEGEDHLVAELLEPRSDLGLLRLVLVQRLQVLLDQLVPELHLPRPQGLQTKSIYLQFKHN